MSEQAFPSDGYIDERTGERWNTASGMTLRDYFAAKAMQATIVDAIQGKLRTDTGAAVIHIVAAGAYEVADAMLKAREA